MFMCKSCTGGAARTWSTYNGFLKQRKHYIEADSGSGEILKVAASFPAQISIKQNLHVLVKTEREDGVGKGEKKVIYAPETT